MRHALLTTVAGIAMAVCGGAAIAAAGGPGKKMDRVETRAEVQTDVARMFGKLDANKDGFITQAEIDAQREHRMERLEKRADHFDPAKMMARLDSNKDGKVTKAEADAAMAARMAAKGKAGNAHGKGAGRLFARADANKDGVLTSAELAALKPGEKRLERMAAGKGGHGGPMGRMFGAADANKDGKVSLAGAQAAAIQHFDRADANRDGKVSPDERKALRQQMKANRPAG
jgi:hypothetical protein